MTQSKEKAGNLEVRPPVVVVMGHVDHGKTTLLDYIRKTSIAEREAGGITQSVGAYEVTHNEKKITFIDTPGHEAFTKMRARGADVADIAILVVAADDGVKDQTKEAIRILKESETPFIVAITKIDKNNADVERAKSQLMAEEILLEGYGGSVSWQGVNSKSGEGVNELLDLVLLHAEVEGYECDTNIPASGYVIEAEKDNRRGASATVIVKNGILKEGDEIKTPSVRGKIKILENFLGEKVKELKPCAPALIIGLPDLPKAGEKFVTGDLEIAKEKETIKKAGEEVTPDMLPVVLKADVAGSLEALTQIIEALEIEDKKVKIINASVGEVTDGDVKAVISSKAPIIAFHTKVSKTAESLARAQGIKIFSSEIIYELVKLLEEYFEKEYGKHVIGELEVLKTFGEKEKCQIVGGKVVKGLLKPNTSVEIKRGEEVIGQGKILNLQEKKKDVREVCEGNECGMLCETETQVKPGDHLIMY